MTEQEIKDLIDAYEFTGKDADRVLRICRDVASSTRHEFYSFIQHANNAASAGRVTARELDRLIWNVERSPQATQEPTQ